MLITLTTMKPVICSQILTVWTPLARYLKLIVPLAASLFLVACVTPVSQDDWPSSLPPRTLFEESWEQQRNAGTNSLPLNQHLVWIVRFYQGSILYPIGWNDMTESVLASLDSEQLKKRIATRLYDLGVDISIEWAQDNSKRKIDSNAVAVWGNALRTAVENKEQELFIGKIEKDVADLLGGKLNKREISRDRYYPPQDYDNF